MALKLVLAFFIVGLSVIFTEATNPSNNPRNPRHNLLQITGVQEPETNVLSSRISSNVKMDSNSEILGGYRPLFPPFFPLKTPFASKKVYFDKEYYTRGTDELDLINNEAQDRGNLARALTHSTAPPLHQNLPTNTKNNVRVYQKTTSFSTTNVHSYASTSGVITYLPIFNGQPDLKINKNDHEVAYITYS